MVFIWKGLRTLVQARVRLLGMLRAAGPWPVTGFVAITILASLVPAASALTLALLVGRLVEALGSGADVLGALALPLAALAGIMLTGYLLDSVREPLSYLVIARVDGSYRAQLSRLASTSPTIGALERPQAQGLVDLARADPWNWTERTPGAGALALVLILGRTVTLASTALILAACAWWLVPLLLIPAAIVQRLSSEDVSRWFLAWRGGTEEYRRSRVWSEATFDAGQAKELRIFGLGEYAVGRQQQHVLERARPIWRQQTAGMIRHWRLALLMAGPLAAAMIAIAYLAATGRTPLTVATAAISASTAVYRAFWGDPRDVLGAATVLDAFDELREGLAAPPPATTATVPAARATDDGRSAPRGRSIRFENVTFAYPGLARTVIDGLDLEIRPNELLAIVGLNGAGKSTLIKLLAGLYEPTSGRITYGGVDIREIGIDAWRRQLSIVFQDFVRYHLSVADNVALGNGTVPPDRAAIEAAGADAGLDVVIERLRDGWDTPLARTRTGGVDLSGGQWQQVVLARALYSVRTGAQVLVLDEPTAHLDVRTEFEVFERLAAHKGDASVVLISHRLSTVRQADRIVLLNGGRITESGSHDELMAAGGGYAELFKIQAERFQGGYEDRIEEGELI